MRRIRLAVVSAAAIVMMTAASGCSSDDGGSSASAEATASTKASTKATSKASSVAEDSDKGTVKTASAGKLGTILVDEEGNTLYLFEKDTSTTSTCDGECAKAWPPLETSGTPKAGGSAQDKMLDTSKRSDGKTQVTYNGHPLYTYQGDSNPGDTNGQGLDQFGAKWYVLDADGNKVVKGDSGKSSSPGGSGY
ncbi:hypothetical protein O7599_26235 [Streptomyces sp. WMMC500]|uniref:COG4315 family predicted lipoprotein n=1 Tax=Streptomyces sp. WMMC500 TaxID=3015154 RepID=UPI00248AF56F|nr:hypothetical protein [Streptomyces sp. WMMC500]WBB59078.1 hypothetical protein O7599_26235 [Streptomyces sp. WMMC500]